MKLIALSINNIRRISAMEMGFDERGITEIRGPNEQGKTTVLDCIEILLQGKRKITADILKHGTAEGSITGELRDDVDNEYVVTRVIKKGGRSSLKIKCNGDAMTKSPESFLKSLVNGMTFDPRPFTGKTDNEKFLHVMGIAGIDFTEIDKKIDKKYEERTFIGRDIKTLGKIEIPEKVEKVSISDLISRRDEIVHRNRLYDAETEKRDSLELDIENIEIELSNLARDLVSKKDAIAKIHPPRKRDTGEIDRAISTAESRNELAMEYDNAAKSQGRLNDIQRKYDTLTDAISQYRNKKIEILQSADLPVEGLKLQIDGLYYNDIHSGNWSESQSINIGADLCRSLNPELRAVFIDRAEAYDPQRLEELNLWACENDFAAIITIVSGVPENYKEEDGVYYIVDGDILREEERS